MLLMLSTGYIPFYLNKAMHPVVPSSFLTASTLSSTQELVLVLCPFAILVNSEY